jgi:alpha,alpha-trehalase
MSSTPGHRSRGSEEYGVFDDAKTYYASEERHSNRYGVRTRTYSQVGTTLRSKRYNVLKPALKC